ncbi:MAG: nucleotide sugar dehydrogenase [Muribaculaceae bacterium]|nr:nucleotide sugar dehydrogenase [Muribaculaceae bacterium]
MIKERIGVIGLGYVGLPLACLLSSKYEVRGFDISTHRLRELHEGFDSTLEVDTGKLREAFGKGLSCSDDPEILRDCTFYIVTVPTPVTSNHEPELEPLESASRLIGTVVKKGDVVVYESTVYPGTTEEFCIPIIEDVSGLKCGTDFMAGYSPERINPGDRVHTVENICKIVSGSSPEALDRIDKVYSSVIKAGTYRAQSIKVAEAAKVIENTQRDVSIAFFNEVTKVFNALGIDTSEVIDAASTKWNFQRFEPGLVGGHCIGVDPYYLIRKAELHGMHPRLIAEARNVNESMGFYLSDRVVAALNRSGKPLNESKVLVLGFSFKKDCPDIRNTKVYDTITGLSRFGTEVVVFDPWVDPKRVEAEYSDVPLVTRFDDAVAKGPYDVVVRAVDHTLFRSLDLAVCKAPDCVECAIINPDNV